MDPADPFDQIPCCRGLRVIDCATTVDVNAIETEGCAQAVVQPSQQIRRAEASGGEVVQSRRVRLEDMSTGKRELSIEAVSLLRWSNALIPC